MSVVKPDALVWKEHTLFNGVLIATLVGDPSKAEVVVQRAKIPANYKIAAHGDPVVGECAADQG